MMKYDFNPLSAGNQKEFSEEKFFARSKAECINIETPFNGKKMHVQWRSRKV